MSKNKEEIADRFREGSYKCPVDALKNQRVVIYCRTATVSPDQVSSIELFIKHYEDFIKEHEGWTLVGIYVDKGVSGSSAKNIPDLQRMLKDARNGTFDLIITRDISRFARNMPDSIEIVRELWNLTPPVGVYFETENLYTLKKTAEFLMEVFCAMKLAEEEENPGNAEDMTTEQDQEPGYNCDALLRILARVSKEKNIDQGVEQCEKE